MRNNMEDTSQKFLDELTELCNRYGVMITGCGCCGSPFLRKITPGFYRLYDQGQPWYGRDLRYVEPDDPDYSEEVDD
jgi:hypothetical protein